MGSEKCIMILNAVYNGLEKDCILLSGIKCMSIKYILQVTYVQTHTEQMLAISYITLLLQKGYLFK